MIQVVQGRLPVHATAIVVCWDQLRDEICDHVRRPIETHIPRGLLHGATWTLPALCVGSTSLVQRHKRV